MLAGFEPSNMQDRCWLQRNTKRIEFRVDVDPFSSSHKTAGTEGTAGNSLVGPLHARGKEIPERTGDVERVASLGFITFLCSQCSLRELSPRLWQSLSVEALAERVRVFRLCEAEHYQVAAVTMDRVWPRCR
jgi:hypothetical protein